METSREEKRKSKEDEISTVKRQHISVEECLRRLGDADKMYVEAEKKNKMDLLITSNALKKTSKENMKLMKDLDTTLSNLRDELKGI